MVEEIKVDGFKDPLTVIPISQDGVQDDWPEGQHYMIIGGEHRFKAGELLGYEELPCFIEEDWDETTQRIKTVRLNLLTGDLNPAKFTKLVKELSETIDPYQLPELFGFADDKDMSKHIIQEKSKAEKTFLDGLLQDSKKEKVAIDSITDIVADIFSQSSGTLDQNYLFFTYKGQLHMAIICDKDTFSSVKDMVKYLQETGETVTQFMVEAISGKLNS